MPQLFPDKYERFAKALSEGMEPVVAAQLCGFSGKNVAEQVLYGPMGEAVRSRVNELLGREASPGDEFTDIEKTPTEQMDQRWVREQMRNTYANARRMGQFKPAIEALRLIGMDNDMFIQKREISFRSVKEMTTSQIKKLLVDLQDDEYSSIPQAELPPPIENDKPE